MTAILLAVFYALLLLPAVAVAVLAYADDAAKHMTEELRLPEPASLQVSPTVRMSAPSLNPMMKLWDVIGGFLVSSPSEQLHLHQRQC